MSLNVTNFDYLPDEDGKKEIKMKTKIWKNEFEF